ncbi:MAG: HAD family phosphatase [Alphaproteobacteria bacterium]|nr:HAD family phosphatase [Alphaproteobacteria bacterium SS10]
MLSRPLAVLTDIDGTMALSEELHAEGTKKIAKAVYGIDLTEEELREINGQGAKKRFEMIERALERSGKDPAKANQAEFDDMMTAYFMTNWDKVTVMPGAQRVLNKLSANDVPMGAVTNATSDVADVTLAVLGDEREHLQFTVSLDDVLKGKPDPEGYLKGAAKLGLTTPEQRSQIVALEDSLVGVEAAKRAGFKVIQIQTDPKMIHPQADLVVKDLNDPRVDYLLGIGPDPAAIPRKGLAA